MVTLFATLSLLAAITSAFMGAIVLFWNPRSTLNRVFAFLSFSVAYWAFMESMLRHSSSYDEAFFFIKALFLFPLTVALFLHFALVFAGRDKALKKPVTYLLIYGPAAVISLLYLSFSQMRGSPGLESWGWSYANPEWAFASDLTLLVVLTMAGIAVYVCVKHYLTQTDRLLKARARYVLAGLLIPAVLGMFSEGLLPMVHVRIPELTSISFGIGCAGLIGYAIVRYDLFISTPVIPAEKILSVMTDSLIFVNTKGIIVTANDSALSLLGYKQEELTGKSIGALSKTGKDLLRGEDRVQENGGRMPDMETSLRSKDGTLTPVMISGSPSFDRNNRLQGHILVAKDITGRKKAEDALRESEQRFRKIFEEGPLGMSIVGLDFRFLKVNRTLAEMAGYPEKALLGISFAEITHPDDISKDLDAGKKLISGEIPSYRSVKRYFKSGGEQVWINLFVSLVRDEKGNPLYFLVMMEDISDSKRAEEQILKQSSQLESVNRELLALNQISAAVSQTIELDELLSLALKTVTNLDIFKMSRKGGILLVEGDRLRLASYLGHKDGFLGAHKHLTVNDCLCGEAARSGELIVSTCAFEDRRHTIRYPGMKDHGHAIVPLKMGDRVTGVMYLYLPTGTEVSKRNRNLLLTIGSQMAVAIENACLYDKTKSLSLHDPLTGLANRNLMNIEMENNAARAKRSGTPYALIMLDLDNFKHYNDTFGHSAGDRLLSDIGEILSSEVREIDMVARYGGEEFLIILPETNSVSAMEVAKRIRVAIDSREFFYAKDRPPTRMTVSRGVAAYGEDMPSADVLLARADSSLYRAKENGRNRVEAWLPKLSLP